MRTKPATTTIPSCAARLGWAALAVIPSRRAHHVVPYVKQRQAFGEPIAHRQAVAFMCANIAIELDGLRLDWRGASRAEQGLPFAREAAPAKGLAPARACRSVILKNLLGGPRLHPRRSVERWYRLCEPRRRRGRYTHLERAEGSIMAIWNCRASAGDHRQDPSGRCEMMRPIARSTT